MKVAFVGTLIAYRPLNVKGIQIGQIDVIQTGDHRFPTKVYSINVADQAYCRIVIEVMEAIRNPLIRCILWLDIQKTEWEISLLELVSVNEALLPLKEAEPVG